MRLRDLMSDDVESIAPDEDATTARQRMTLRRIHHLVVLDGREVVGVVSSRDLKGVRADATIADVMSRSAVTATPDTTMRKAANLLRGHGIGCLPIVDGRNKLVGIVTVSDLLTAIGSGQERPVEQGKRWTLKHRGPRGSAAFRSPPSS